MSKPVSTAKSRGTFVARATSAAKAPAPRISKSKGRIMPGGETVEGKSVGAYGLSPQKQFGFGRDDDGQLAAKVKAKTLRLEPAFEVGLGILKGVLRKPFNKMVNEAVGEYIEKRTAEVETDLTGVLEQLKAYRRADPGFKQALAEFVEAEARYGVEDPVEGVIVDVEPPRTKARKSKAGPAETMVRELLRN